MTSERPIIFGRELDKTTAKELIAEIEEEFSKLPGEESGDYDDYSVAMCCLETVLQRRRER